VINQTGKSTIRTTIFIFVIGSLIANLLNAQQVNSYEKLWSKTERLTVADFQFEVKENTPESSFAQFSINYSVSGFDFLTKNFNQKVKNIMFKNASWINSNDKDTIRLIKYQQVLFDLSELYTRKFRRELLLNKKKIAKGTQIVEDLNNQISKELAEKRAEFESDSQGGLKMEILTNWENKISLKLNELETYNYNNKEKIKIAKE